MTHAQMCDTDLRRCCSGAGFLEHRLVWSPCQSHRCDIAMVLRGGGSQHDTCTDVCHRPQEMLLRCRIPRTSLSLVTLSVSQVNIAMVLRGGGSQHDTCTDVCHRPQEMLFVVQDS